MRVLHEVVIIGMALALVSPALAGGKSGGGTSHTPTTTQTPTAKTGGNTTKGGKQEYLQYNFGTVFTSKSGQTGGGSTGPTASPKPTQGNVHR